MKISVVNVTPNDIFDNQTNVFKIDNLDSDQWVNKQLEQDKYNNLSDKAKLNIRKEYYKKFWSIRDKTIADRANKILTTSPNQSIDFLDMFAYSIIGDKHANQQVFNARKQWKTFYNLTRGNIETGSAIGYDIETFGDYRNTNSGITELGVNIIDFAKGNSSLRENTKLSFALGINKQQEQYIRDLVTRYKEQGWGSLDNNEQVSLKRMSIYGSGEFNDVFKLTEQNFLNNKDKYFIVNKVAPGTLSEDRINKGIDNLVMLYNTQVQQVKTPDVIIREVTDTIIDYSNQENTIVFAGNNKFDTSFLKSKYKEKELEIEQLANKTVDAVYAPRRIASYNNKSVYALHDEIFNVRKGASIQDQLDAQMFNEIETHIAGEDVYQTFKLLTTKNYYQHKSLSQNVLDTFKKGKPDLDSIVFYNDSNDKNILFLKRGTLDKSGNDFAVLTNDSTAEPTQNYSIRNRYYKLDESHSGVYDGKYVLTLNSYNDMNKDNQLTISKQFNTQEDLQRFITNNIEVLDSDYVSVNKRLVSRQYKHNMLDFARREYEAMFDIAKVSKIDNIEVGGYASLVNTLRVYEQIKDKNLIEYNTIVKDKSYEKMNAYLQDNKLFKSEYQKNAFINMYPIIDRQYNVLKKIQKSIDTAYPNADNIQKTIALSAIRKMVLDSEHIDIEDLPIRDELVTPLLEDIYSIDLNIVKDNHNEVKKVFLGNNNIQEGVRQLQRIFNTSSNKEIEDTIMDLTEVIIDNTEDEVDKTAKVIGRKLITNETANALISALRKTPVDNRYGFYQDMAIALSKVVDKEVKKDLKYGNKYTTKTNIGDKNLVRTTDALTPFLNEGLIKVPILNKKDGTMKDKIVSFDKLYNLDSSFTNGVSYSDIIDENIKNIIKKTPSLDYIDFTDTYKYNNRASIDDKLLERTRKKKLTELAKTLGYNPIEYEILETSYGRGKNKKTKEVEVIDDTVKALYDIFYNEKKEYSLASKKDLMRALIVKPDDEINKGAYVLLTTKDKVTQLLKNINNDMYDFTSVSTLLDTDIGKYSAVMQLPKVVSYNMGTSYNEDYMNTIGELLAKKVKVGKDEPKEYKKPPALNFLYQSDKAGKFLIPKLDFYTFTSEDGETLGMLEAKEGIYDIISSYRQVGKSVIENIESGNFDSATKSMRHVKNAKLSNLSDSSSYRAIRLNDGTIKRVMNFTSQDYLKAYSIETTNSLIDLFNYMSEITPNTKVETMNIPQRIRYGFASSMNKRIGRGDFELTNDNMENVSKIVNATIAQNNADYTEWLTKSMFHTTVLNNVQYDDVATAIANNSVVNEIVNGIGIDIVSSVSTTDEDKYTWEYKDNKTMKINEKRIKSDFDRPIIDIMTQTVADTSYNIEEDNITRYDGYTSKTYTTLLTIAENKDIFNQVNQESSVSKGINTIVKPGDYIPMSEFTGTVRPTYPQGTRTAPFVDSDFSDYLRGDDKIAWLNGAYYTHREYYDKLQMSQTSWRTPLENGIALDTKSYLTTRIKQMSDYELQKKYRELALNASSEEEKKMIVYMKEQLLSLFEDKGFISPMLARETLFSSREPKKIKLNMDILNRDETVERLKKYQDNIDYGNGEKYAIINNNDIIGYYNDGTEKYWDGPSIKLTFSDLDELIENGETRAFQVEHGMDDVKIMVNSAEKFTAKTINVEGFLKNNNIDYKDKTIMDAYIKKFNDLFMRLSDNAELIVNFPIIKHDTDIADVTFMNTLSTIYRKAGKGQELVDALNNIIDNYKDTDIFKGFSKAEYITTQNYLDTVNNTMGIKEVNDIVFTTSTAINPGRAFKTLRENFNPNKPTSSIIYGIQELNQKVFDILAQDAIDNTATVTIGRANVNESFSNSLTMDARMEQTFASRNTTEMPYYTDANRRLYGNKIYGSTDIYKIPDDTLIADGIADGINGIVTRDSKGILRGISYDKEITNYLKNNSRDYNYKNSNITTDGLYKKYTDELTHLKNKRYDTNKNTRLDRLRTASGIYESLLFYNDPSKYTINDKSIIRIDLANAIEQDIVPKNGSSVADLQKSLFFIDGKPGSYLTEIMGRQGLTRNDNVHSIYLDFGDLKVKGQSKGVNNKYITKEFNGVLIPILSIFSNEEDKIFYQDTQRVVASFINRYRDILFNEVNTDTTKEVGKELSQNDMLFQKIQELYEELNRNASISKKDSDAYRITQVNKLPNSGQVLAQDETPPLIEEMIDTNGELSKMIDAKYDMEKELSITFNSKSEDRDEKRIMELYNALNGTSDTKGINDKIDDALNVLAEQIRQGKIDVNFSAIQDTKYKDVYKTVTKINGKDRTLYGNVIAVSEKVLTENGLDIGQVGMDIFNIVNKYPTETLGNATKLPGDFRLTEEEVKNVYRTLAKKGYIDVSLSDIKDKSALELLKGRTSTTDSGIGDTIQEQIEQFFSMDGEHSVTFDRPDDYVLPTGITIRDLNESIKSKNKKPIDDLLNDIKEPFEPIAKRFLSEEGLFINNIRYPIFRSQPIVKVVLDTALKGSQVRLLTPFSSSRTNADFDGDSMFLNLILNGNSVFFNDNPLYQKLKKSYELSALYNNNILATYIEEGSSLKRDLLNDVKIISAKKLEDFNNEKYNQIGGIWIRNNKEKYNLPPGADKNIDLLSKTQKYMLDLSDEINLAYLDSNFNTLTDARVQLMSLVASLRKVVIGQYSVPNNNLRTVLSHALGTSNYSYSDADKFFIHDVLRLFGNMLSEDGGLGTVTEQKAIDVKHLRQAFTLSQAVKWSTGVNLMFSNPNIVLTDKHYKSALRNMVTASNNTLFKATNDELNNIVNEIMATPFSEYQAKLRINYDDITAYKGAFKGLIEISQRFPELRKLYSSSLIAGNSFDGSIGEMVQTMLTNKDFINTSGNINVENIADVIDNAISKPKYNFQIGNIYIETPRLKNNFTTNAYVYNADSEFLKIDTKTFSFIKESNEEPNEELTKRTSKKHKEKSKQKSIKNIDIDSTNINTPFSRLFNIRDLRESMSNPDSQIIKDFYESRNQDKMFFLLQDVSSNINDKDTIGKLRDLILDPKEIKDNKGITYEYSKVQKKFFGDDIKVEGSDAEKLHKYLSRLFYVPGNSEISNKRRYRNVNGKNKYINVHTDADNLLDAYRYYLLDNPSKSSSKELLRNLNEDIVREYQKSKTTHKASSMLFATASYIDDEGNNITKNYIKSYNELLEDRLLDAKYIGNKDLLDYYMNKTDTLKGKGFSYKTYAEKINNIKRDIKDTSVLKPWFDNYMGSFENLYKQYNDYIETNKVELTGDSKYTFQKIVNVLKNKDTMLEKDIEALNKYNKHILNTNIKDIYDMFKDKSQLDVLFNWNTEVPTNNTTIGFGELIGTKFNKLNKQQIDTILQTKEVPYLNKMSSESKLLYEYAFNRTKELLEKYATANKDSILNADINIDENVIRKLIPNTYNTLTDIFNDLYRTTKRMYRTETLDDALKGKAKETIEDISKEKVAEETIKETAETKGKKIKRPVSDILGGDKMSLRREVFSSIEDFMDTHNISIKKVAGAMVAIGIANHLLHDNDKKSPLMPDKNTNREQSKQDAISSSNIEQAQPLNKSYILNSVYHDAPTGLNFKISARSKATLDYMRTQNIMSTAGGGYTNMTITKDNSRVTDSWLANKFAQLAY